MAAKIFRYAKGFTCSKTDDGYELHFFNGYEDGVKITGLNKADVQAVRKAMLETVKTGVTAGAE